LKKKKGEKRETLDKPYPHEKEENDDTRTVQQGKKINSPRQFIHTS